MKLSVRSDKQVEVTRQEYNAQAGAETPEQPSIPSCAKHVWDWWWHLNSRRPSGFENLDPIPYGEIESWMNLTNSVVAPEEVEWITTMDNAWLVAISKERKAKQERDKDDAKNRGNKP